MGIVKKKMETTIMGYRSYIGILLETPITQIVTPMILIINLLPKSPDPPSTRVERD